MRIKSGFGRCIFSDWIFGRTKSEMFTKEFNSFWPLPQCSLEMRRAFEQTSGSLPALSVHVWAGWVGEALMCYDPTFRLAMCGGSFFPFPFIGLLALSPPMPSAAPFAMHSTYHFRPIRFGKQPGLHINKSMRLECTCPKMRYTHKRFRFRYSQCSTTSSVNGSFRSGNLPNA